MLIRLTTKFIQTALALLLLAAVATNGQTTPSGTVVSNEARAVYGDTAGNSYATKSDVVTFVVRAVPRLSVSPDETDPTATIAANERLTRAFRVCNTGNVDDSYIVSSISVNTPSSIAGTYFDIDNDGIIGNADAAATIGSTVTPQLAPGACINVLADLQTNAIQVGAPIIIDLQMVSRTDSNITDRGRIINIAGTGAILADPNQPNAPPLKLVNGQPTYTGAYGERLNYSVSFRNRGDVAARDVVVTDDLPAGLAYVPNSLRLENRALTDAAGDDEGTVRGQNIEVRLAAPVAPDATVNISFQAIVTSAVVAGTGIVNTALVGAGNAPAAGSSTASVVVSPFGVVYAANSGASVPVANANIAVFEDAGLTVPAAFRTAGYDPNNDNINPYVTAAQGHYSFALGSPAITRPGAYFVNVAAEGYRTRLIGVVATPSADGGLFDLRVSSLDGLPVAVAGGFDLTNESVDLPNVAALAANIPMFSRSTLEIIKSADRPQAEVGQNVTYLVDVRNGSSEQLNDVVIVDTLPDSFNYIPGTARLASPAGEISVEPLPEGRSLVFRVGPLGPGERARLSYRVAVGVNARLGDQYNVAVGRAVLPNGVQVTTQPAKALVRVLGGLFSMRQVIVGRVFVDANANGKFDKGEKGLAGIRLYLAGGASSITDTEGLYSFPAVAEGAQVMEIDPLTIPAGHYLAPSKSVSDRSWTRLLSSPLAGGGMLRQDWALVAPQAAPAKPATPGPDYSTVRTAFRENEAKNGEKTNSGDTKTDKPGETTPAMERVFEPVAAGDIRVENIASGDVIASPAMNLEVSVFQKYTVGVRLNEISVPEGSVGSTREDAQKQVTTYTFVGLGLKPGPNKVTVTAYGPNGVPAASRETVVYGRGRAARIEIAPARRELEASGRDKTVVRVRAFDAWNNPAQDAAVAVQTSAGSLLGGDAPKKSDDPAAALLENPGAVQSLTVNLSKGAAEFEIVAGNQTGEAEIKAAVGSAETSEKIRFIPEMRPTILVGVGQVSVGRNAPDAEILGSNDLVRSRLQFFFRGPAFSRRNLLTVGYDSNRSLNRVTGQDRMFQLSALDRQYPMLGDSSTRFQETESNSKLYARLDRGRNYAMFGDFTADMDGRRLLGYDRKLTGVKLHLETGSGDSVTFTGARPDTAFARQIIPGGTLSLVSLEHINILPGSETLTLEVRDRRNPEIILKREMLSRGIDYNLDPLDGIITFLRPITAFDYDLNLIQVVATYEHRSSGRSNDVYTGRVVKSFADGGLKFGFSAIQQGQSSGGPFRVGGADLAIKTPGRGLIEGEFALSKGVYDGGGAFGGFAGLNSTAPRDGHAMYLAYNQPLSKIFRGTLRAEFARATEMFSNPFGATVTPGSARGVLGLELRPFERSMLKLGYMSERNRTANVDNRRETFGASWMQSVTSELRLSLGYDHRRFSDKTADRETDSNLVTAGVEWKPTDKIELSVKREQNLSEADPSFPDQTTLAGSYQVNEFSKVFFTQRLASAEISPIADVGGTGFAASRARRETAIGVESRFGRFANIVGRYQLENGTNSRDGFAVIGLNNRLSLNKQVAIDFGYERGFHLFGDGKSFDSVSFGTNWTPAEGFRASARYELRNRGGLGQSFSFGAAGILKPGWTTLARIQYGKVRLDSRLNRIIDGEIAAAVRPHDTDRYGFLTSYRRRDSFLSSRIGDAPTRLRDDTFSTDGFRLLGDRLEFYGRVAARLSADGDEQRAYASTLTYLFQGRAQYRVQERLDLAFESRTMTQPFMGSWSQNYALETGIWATPDLRFGVGYNLKRIGETNSFGSRREGMYFTITTKLSNLFDLFGTSRKGLTAPAVDRPADPSAEAAVTNQ